VKVEVGYYDTYSSVQLINTTLQFTKQQSNEIHTNTHLHI